MKKITLERPRVVAGRVYGPGEGIEVSDEVAARLKSDEKKDKPEKAKEK